MLRFLLPILVLLLAAAVAFVLLEHSPGATDRGVTVERGDTGALPVPAGDVLATPRAGPMRESVEAAGVETTELEPAAPAGTVTAQRTVRVVGEVVLLDDNRRLPSAQGSIDLVLAFHRKGQPAPHEPARAVAVEGGRFEVELELEPDVVRVLATCRQGVLNGLDVTAARASSGEIFDLSDAPEQVHEVRLELRPVDDPVLVVRAAETGLELSRVSVVSSIETMAASQGACHPESEGRLRPVVEGERSPVRLSWRDLDQDWTRFVYVGARGREWRQVGIAPQLRIGNRVEVSLPRAGSARVEVTGGQPGATLRFRIYPDQGSVPLIERRMGAELRASFDGIPAGHWRATVQRGEWFQSPATLAEVAFEVEVGREAAVELTLTADQAAPPLAFPVELHVRLPRAWGDELGRWRLEMIENEAGERQRDSRASNQSEWLDESDAWTLWRVPLGERLPGTHAISTYEHGVGAAFLVAGPGVIPVELPVPVRRIVRMFEPDGVTPLLNVIPTWSQRIPGAASAGTGSMFRANATETPGVYEFRAPEGEINLSVHDRERGLHFRRWEPTVPDEVFDFVLEARATLLVRVRRDGEAVPAPSLGWDLIPEVIDAEGQPASKSISLTEQAFQFNVAPGWLTVHPIGLEGCRAPEPVSLTIGAGDEREVILDYTHED